METLFPYTLSSDEAKTKIPTKRGKHREETSGRTTGVLTCSSCHVHRTDQHIKNTVYTHFLDKNKM